MWCSTSCGEKCGVCDGRVSELSDWSEGWRSTGGAHGFNAMHYFENLVFYLGTHFLR